MNPFEENTASTEYAAVRDVKHRATDE